MKTMIYRLRGSLCVCVSQSMHNLQWYKVTQWVSNTIGLRLQQIYFIRILYYQLAFWQSSLIIFIWMYIYCLISTVTVFQNTQIWSIITVQLLMQASLISDVPAVDVVESLTLITLLRGGGKSRTIWGVKCYTKLILFWTCLNLMVHWLSFFFRLIYSLTFDLMHWEA